MMKVYIERRSVDVSAACLAPGTFFTYKDESREDLTTKWTATGTLRHIAKTYPDCPLVSWGYSVEDGKGYISLVGKEW